MINKATVLILSFLCSFSKIAFSKELYLNCYSDSEYKNGLELTLVSAPESIEDWVLIKSRPNASFSFDTFGVHENGDNGILIKIITKDEACKDAIALFSLKQGANSKYSLLPISDLAAKMVKTRKSLNCEVDDEADTELEFF